MASIPSLITGVETTGSSYLNAVYQAASTYGVDPALLLAIGQAESSNNPSVGNSSTGAIGPFQVEPATGASLGFTTQQLQTVQGNANAAAAYLAQLSNTYDGDLGEVIAAYNEGPGQLNTSGTLPSTANYVQNVLSYWQTFTASLPGVGTSSNGDISLSLQNQLNTEAQTAIANPSAGAASAGVTATNGAIPQTQSQAESWFSSLVNSIETNFLLGGIALALVAGGFALIAAGNPKTTTQIAKTGAELA